MGAAKVAETLLEPDHVAATERISRRNRAARTRIRALHIHVADCESDRVAFMHAEESVLPERRNAAEFQ